MMTIVTTMTAVTMMMGVIVIGQETAADWLSEYSVDALVGLGLGLGLGHEIVSWRVSLLRLVAQVRLV